MLQRFAYCAVTALLLLSLGFAFEQQVYAYTDPGSTLLIFQSLGAIASGVLFTFRRQMKRWLTRGAGSKAVVPPPAAMPRMDTAVPRMDA